MVRPQMGRHTGHFNAAERYAAVGLTATHNAPKETYRRSTTFFPVVCSRHLGPRESNARSVPTTLMTSAAQPLYRLSGKNSLTALPTVPWGMFCRGNSAPASGSRSRRASMAMFVIAMR